MAASDSNFSPTSPPSRRRLWGERGLLAVVCLGMLAFYTWTARHEGQSWNFGQRQTDYYNLLAEGFLDGHLYMNVEVPAELLKLADPYNPANRPPGLALHDASMYRGHYYLYFGAAPVVTLLVPFRVLTGTPLPLPAAVIFFTWGAFLTSVALFCAIRRRYFPASCSRIWLLGVVALGTVSMGPLIVLRSSIWELPLSGGYFYGMVALFCVFHSLHAVRRAAWWFAGAGLALGLAVASRPTYLYAAGLIGAPLLWWFWRWTRTRGSDGSPSPWKMALAGLMPLGAVGVAMATYNYARFGSFTEFGVAYQFSGIFEAETQHFRWSYLPLNLRMYFFQPADWNAYFPFIHRAPPPSIPAGHLGFDDLYGVLVNAPWVWLAALAPFALGLRSKNEKGPLGVMLACLALVVAGAVCTLLFFYAAMARYGADFLPSCLLLAGVGALAIDQWVRGLRGAWLAKLVRAGTGLLAVASIFFAVVLSFEAYNNLRRLSPGAYARLATRLNVPSQWWAALAGTTYGPFELEVRLPTGRPPAGTREVLVSTGSYDAGDHVFVQYEGGTRLRLGYAHDGGAEDLSRPLILDHGPTRTLRIEMGSLHPPEEHPYFSALSAIERTRLARRLRVWLDDEVVLDSYQRFHASVPSDIRIAHTQYGTPGLGRFSGELLQVKRTQDVPALRTEKSERLALRVRLADQADTQKQPLVTIGEGASRTTWYLQPGGAGVVRVGCARGGQVQWETEAFVTDPTAGHEIEWSALPRSGGSPVVVVKWDGMIRGTSPSGGPLSGASQFGAAEAGDPTMAATFSGVLHHVDEGEAVAKFDTIRLRVKFPARRGEGREPLVVAGETGRGDFVFVEYLDGNRVRFGLDHWGKATIFSAPVAVDFGAEHGVEIGLESFPGARAMGSKLDPRRLRVVLDGTVVWAQDGRLFAVESQDVFVGRNPIGGTSGAPMFTGAILEVKRLETGWLKASPPTVP